jgi:pyridoxal biosynthesis lyase PdxS
MSFHGSTAATQNGTSDSNRSEFTVKAGLAQMLKGGVIMDVVNAEQVFAFIAQIEIKY